MGTFSCKDSDGGTHYHFTLDLFKPIVRDKSKYSLKRCPEFFLRKQVSNTWDKLNKQGRLQWVKADWNRWADSDDEDEKGAFEIGGMEMDFNTVSKEEVDGSDDRDSILADLD